MPDQNLVQALNDAAGRYGIDPAVAYEQINQESRFNPRAQSGKANGIAQFTPDTAARFGLKNPFDPIASFEAWGQYMRLLLDMFNQRYDLALAGYNSGENRQEYKAAAAEGRPIRWEILPAGVQRETKPYVEGILGRAGYNPGGDVAISFPEETGDAGAGGSSGGLGAISVIGFIGLSALLLLFLGKK